MSVPGTSETSVTNCATVNCSTISLILLVDAPNDSVPKEFTNLLRDAVENVTLPFNVTDDLLLTSIHFTTGVRFGFKVIHLIDANV